MNPISSFEFRSKNQVLHQTRILENQGWDCPHPGTGDWHHVGHVDVLDLNNDAKPERKANQINTGGWIEYTLKITEPSFINSLSQIKEFANRYGAEVVTKEDVGDLQIENTALKGAWKSPNYDIVHESKRSISTLLGELEPFEKGTDWAIDVTSGEFLIYRPK